ncbi:MAG: HAD-IIIA family hydrolase [bacterium]
MNNKKIQNRKKIAEICRNLKKQGKIIGYTSGVFDILHAGHVDYLLKASRLCDVLVVGVNADSSVKEYKGNARPVINEKQRVSIVAALESVDYAFLFSERWNKKNIELFKPHYYIKAGDYTPKQLTSGHLVEKYGGVVKIIPLKEKISTTQIIDKIFQLKKEDEPVLMKKENMRHYQNKHPKLSTAVFLDRDGTINKEIEYLHEPEKFKFTKNAVEGIKMIYGAGYKIIVVSNQPGIGLGYFSKEDFFKVNKKMLKELSESGILIDKIYFCPHSKSEKCDCRKPGQKLIKLATRELNLDLSQSWFIGDRTSDIETGRRAGMSTIMVKTGYQGNDEEFTIEPNYYTDDLKTAADIILSKKAIN